MSFSKIQLRRDTSINWETNNPILAVGEVGLDITNRIMKVGDGISGWNSLGSWSVWGNSIITVGEEPPASPSEGDIWIQYGVD